jgi:hypothetical protein
MISSWYQGIPLQNSCPPLLRTLVAAFAWMVHIYPALAHHQASAALYCLGPVTVFLLADRLARDWRLGLAAGIT